MARGHPDYGQGQATTVISTVADLGELAARLGSPVTFDRSGNVMWYDGPCDTKIVYMYGTQGPGGDVAADTTLSHRYDTSLKLTADDDDANNTWIIKNIPVVDVSTMGVEITFRPTANLRMMHLGVKTLTGTQEIEGKIRIDAVNQQLQYLDENDAFQDFLSIGDVAGSTQLWHTLKLVIDTDNGEYVRCLFDSVLYTFDDVKLHISSASDLSHVAIFVNLYGKTGVFPELNLNDFIYTINEPI